MQVPDRINALRGKMTAAQLSACIIPGSDPHISEYPAGCWKYRKWISGFTGSAGTVAITLNKAGLWTDSRYFLQAENELSHSGIDLYKEKISGTPELKDWISTGLPAGSVVGVDGRMFQASELQALQAFFKTKQIQLVTDFQPLDELWQDRPAFPSGKLFLLPEEFSGQSARSKIEALRQDMAKHNATVTVIAALDAVAWLFNIRGTDVDCNPVGIAYSVVTETEAILFVSPGKLSAEVATALKEEGVILAEYDKIIDYIRNLPADTRLLVNSAKINFALFDSIPETCSIIDLPVHPVDQLKSIKNETELTGIRHAMEKDGVALVRFCMWLEKSLKENHKVTELNISEKLIEFRSRQALYVGESFSTIAGYGAHGAIVHYSADTQSNAVVQPEGFLLVDSGAQYFDGTTDITRTLAVGTVDQTMKEDYTCVLKGHIALASIQFPQNTRGCQLDILARKSLWERGLNYLHGTGHGVGHFLNVHEGPQNIRLEYNPTCLQPGMVTSNEPGIYRSGAYGIRIENLILTVPGMQTDFGDFYRFETLTLFPIDTTPIIKEMLLDTELLWLNEYHQMVYDRLSPFLTEEEKRWLKEKTDAI